MQQKVFGIGLSKTGTSSLGAALQALGFKTKHFPHPMLKFEAPRLTRKLCSISNQRVSARRWGLSSIRQHLYQTGRNAVDLEYLAEFDASTDLPVGLYYRELDQRYPGSKFILTVRPETEWLESARSHFDLARAQQTRHEWNRMRIDVYGSILFDKKKFLNAYRSHIAAVKKHFRGRESDLLVMDIPSGDGWDTLCSFTDKAVPQTAFPHVNRTNNSDEACQQ